MIHIKDHKQEPGHFVGEGVHSRAHPKQGDGMSSRKVMVWNTLVLRQHPAEIQQYQPSHIGPYGEFDADGESIHF